MNFIIKYLQQTKVAWYKITLVSKQSKSTTSEFITLTCFDFQYRCIMSILEIRLDLWPKPLLFYLPMKMKMKF